jgi:hypothetical protein
LRERSVTHCSAASTSGEVIRLWVRSSENGVPPFCHMYCTVKVSPVGRLKPQTFLPLASVRVRRRAVSTRASQVHLPWDSSSVGRGTPAARKWSLLK